MNLVRWKWFCLFYLLFVGCSSKFGSLEDWIGVLNASDRPRVLTFTPNLDAIDVDPKAMISIVFSHPMSIQSCVSGFSLEPPVRGSFETTDISLKFIPKAELSSGGYIVRLTKQCEDKSGKDLDRVYTIPFRVGEKPTLEPTTVASIIVLTGTESECLTGGTPMDILLGEVLLGCSGVPGPPPIQVRFSKPMNQTEVGLGLRMEPAISFRLEWTSPSQVQILTDTMLAPNVRYHILLSAGIHSLDGGELSESFREDFLVGNLSDPEVIGFGLESQSCGLGIQEIGTLTSARWDSGFCFWSLGLPILNPHSYQFRGGDDGTATASACADVNTDNFRIFFNQYMDTTSVIGATRFSKISPPSTNIRLSTWVWSHCQTVSPFGCRELTYSYAESEASCNGSLFGNISTGGDFNLSASALAPNFYPYYEFRLEAEAKSVSGKRMKNAFVIQVEAK
ncbi:Ig-like protein [Leptospira congkakensis]|uniref:Ig-like protein n=1 Tax=Leptospira congkakensis TaxID=2484932 RepID=A0A4Z1ADI1_9LEPT|nr:Ig-like domain-containing protein [Leptospira congkakensis]TGL87864.1 Ig-like protein [Leptospira congkakensis]TGL92641.1 Ig-like protein [Leptospira congkakensis]TGL96014.1 Ig-like protein [Leptospira congkakensis]